MRRRPGSGPAAQAFEERTGVKAPRVLLSTKEYKKSLPVLLGGALKL